MPKAAQIAKQLPDRPAKKAKETEKTKAKSSVNGDKAKSVKEEKAKSVKSDKEDKKEPKKTESVAASASKDQEKDEINVIESEKLAALEAHENIEAMELITGDEVGVLNPQGLEGGAAANIKGFTTQQCFMFLLIAFGFIAGILYAIHRYRRSQLTVKQKQVISRKTDKDIEV